ncbi:hypothetical protein BGZ89_002370 [Linnemannia elongata]|nr:hypothetical protein BGZ89_002370 [Linnemannia elongata]
MLSTKLSSSDRQRTRRKTVLKQLATTLGPAWTPDTPTATNTITSPTTATATTVTTRAITSHRRGSEATPPPKRLRKTVELFNPSSSPATRRKRSSSTSTRQRNPTGRGPGRPRGSTKQAKAERASKATQPSSHRRLSSSATPASSSTTSSPGQHRQRSRQERREDQKLNDAAHASRLHAHGLCREEFELFQYHIGRSDLESYLKVRNTMLWLWREKPDEPLTLARAFEETKSFGLHHGLIAHVYEFLLRSGYINFGGCPFQDEAAGDQGEKANGRQNSSTRRHTITMDSSASRRTIVVIGSGIAGIGAAKQLENLFQYYAWKFAPELPPRVVVLEARSRVGGRMHSFELNTKPSPSSTKEVNKAKVERHCVDLGAQIITGFENGNPMDIIVRRQLKDLQLHYLVEETCDLFGHDGQLVPKAMDVRCEAVFNEILEQACQLREEDETPKALLAYLGDRVKMDGRGPGRVHSTELPTLGHSMDYFIQTHPKFKSWSSQELGLIHWHYANLEFANATPLDQLSLRHWDQDDDYEFAGHHCMVKEGYGQVPVRLSQGLDVRLNQPVSLIERSTTSSDFDSHRRNRSDHELIHIQCRDGTAYECSAVVVTVPLGVLKSGQIQFSPSLPDWKEQAIGNLGFGLLNKLVLVFDKPFWDTSVELFGYVGSGQEGSSGRGYNLKVYRSSRGKFYMYWNCIVVSGLPVLVTLMAGQSAYDCENMSKEDLVQEALDSLALIHPNIKKVPAPVETIVTRWSQDEFAQGSYSFVGQKGTGDDYDRLSKSVDGQLYFAGEATSRQYPATAHGAYLSGLKVAKEILDSLIGPQAVRSRHTEDEDRQAKVEKEGNSGMKPENGVSAAEGIESQDVSSNGSERSHLLSMEDAQTTDTPPPDAKVEPSLLMSLGHGFVIPKRRGRVSRSIVAEFVAERSEDDSDSETGKKDEDEGSGELEEPEQSSESNEDSEGEEDSESEDGDDNDGDGDESVEEYVVSKARKAPFKSRRILTKPTKVVSVEDIKAVPVRGVEKRGRGRPRKYPLLRSSETQPVTTSVSRPLAVVTKARTEGNSNSSTTTATTASSTMTNRTRTTTATAAAGVFKRKLSLSIDGGEAGKAVGGKLGPMRQTRARYEAHYLGQP